MSLTTHLLRVGLVCIALTTAGIALAGPGGPSNDGVGIYDVTNGNFWVRDMLTTGPADNGGTLGGGGAFIGITGDWNGDGVEGIGLYDPATGNWWLRDAIAAGNANADPAISFTYGNFGNPNLIPVVGNWDNSGGDGVGLYDPSTGAFFLRDSLSSGPIEYEFGFGTGGNMFLPLAGDWDNNGGDGIGIYDPSNGNFWLRNTPDAGIHDFLVTFGAGGVNFTPVVGNWTGTAYGVGLYDMSNGNFWLRNDLTTGNADTGLTFGPGGVNFTPVIGVWQ